MPQRFVQHIHPVKGLDPVADAFSGTVTSDIINASQYSGVAFVIYKGVGTTGTSTITVEACDDTSGTTVSAIPFEYKVMTSGDTEGALTRATSSGFTTTAGSSQMYIIDVRSEELGPSGYKYVRLKAVEVVDNPVLGGIAAFCYGPRYAQDIPASAIV